MEHLFVYGVFRDIGKTLLKDAKFCGKTYITGSMYQVNDFYPGFIRKGNGKVWGDVYLVNPEIFPELDDFEGPEYIRTKIITSNDIECWIYEWKDDVSNYKQIKCGDWLLR
jgi:gamma-glutamylcyclotransferase (GGCT)/AIG2-like uncharacterized protein YtfP